MLYEQVFRSYRTVIFGIDGDEETAEKDFTAVRGTLEENKFTAGMQKEMEQIAYR